MVPTRLFSILVDPKILEQLQSRELTGVLDLATDLRKSAPPIEISLMIPVKVGSIHPGTSNLPRRPPFEILSVSEEPPEFSPGQHLKGKRRKSLLGDDEEAAHCRMLLSLAERHRADGILTESGALLEARYPLYQDHLCRIVPLKELGDLLELCAHGHSVFWSSTDRNRIYTFDLFYQMAHWKGSRLAKWFFSFEPRLSNDSLKENLRTALLQRYPFVLCARDMTRFYELQMDFFTRRGHSRRFFLPMGYHVNNFYLHLWGMLA